MLIRTRKGLSRGQGRAARTGRARSDHGCAARRASLATSAGTRAGRPGRQRAGVDLRQPAAVRPGRGLRAATRGRSSRIWRCAPRKGVSAVFCPDRLQMYPAEPLVTVNPGPVGRRLEGKSRPGFFDGVLTVVLKLFQLTSPDVAVFGAKDAQQLALIRQMVTRPRPWRADRGRAAASRSRRAGYVKSQRLPVGSRARVGAGAVPRSLAGRSRGRRARAGSRAGSGARGTRGSRPARARR